jgi:hypothetical protein
MANFSSLRRDPNRPRKAVKKAFDLSKLVKTGLNKVEFSMLYVVPEIYVPPTLFDEMFMSNRPLRERLTSQLYLKEFYHETKSNPKTMLEAEKRKKLELLALI